jgi:UDP-N-acetyl-D-galactosamine dehydrogenase
MNENNRYSKIGNEIKICVIGLGYVGLPLCIELANHFSVVGYDINVNRVNELKKWIDSTGEISEKNLAATDAKFCSEISKIKECNVFIVTVPTPIDNQKFPNFEPLISATRSIAGYLKKGDLVIFESTVYPGATREICIPIIERISGLNLNDDVLVAYSPERINPGDHKNSLINTDKLVGASNEAALLRAAGIYDKIITEGKVHKVNSIEIAEAAKIIENTQRDVNIALMNEFSEILGKLGIPTKEVLNAASTKWNFHSYSPGLVGGHCIGVDPYYLINRAHEVGLKPRLISAARYVNESVVDRIVNSLIHKFIERKSTNYELLVVGGTFKENCPDTRNSKSIELVKRLVDLNFCVTLYDPLMNNQISNDLGYKLINKLPKDKEWGGIVLSILHAEMNDEIEYALKVGQDHGAIIFDLKSSFKDIKNEFSL